MRYHISAGNSPDDLAIDIETDDGDYVRQQQRLWPYVNISLLTPIPRSVIDACLEGSERAAYDRGEPVMRSTSGNPVYGRWIQKMDLGPSYEERRKAEGW